MAAQYIDGPTQTPGASQGGPPAILHCSIAEKK